MCGWGVSILNVCFGAMKQSPSQWMECIQCSSAVNLRDQVVSEVGSINVLFHRVFTDPI